MVTDGVAEAMSETDELFGRERFLAALEESRSTPLDALPSLILDRVGAHRGAAPQFDDITVLVVEFRPHERPGAGRHSPAD